MCNRRALIDAGVQTDQPWVMSELRRFAYADGQFMRLLVDKAPTVFRELMMDTY